MAQARPLLQVEELTVSYRASGATVEALGGVDFALEAGDALGLVGLSGSGKSSLGLALMGLLPTSAEVGGRVYLAGEELQALPPAARRDRCGREAAMIFQEPAMALNPVMRIRPQICEALRRRLNWAGGHEADEIVRLLEQVGLAPEVAAAYPHQLSGGQLQRVLIAVAIAPQPKLLIADEPTTALDVLTEAAIFELLAKLQRSLQLAVLLVSHDLRAVRRLCGRALVLDEGRVVEEGALEELLAAPRHPRTRALVEALGDPLGADERGLKDG